MYFVIVVGVPIVYALISDQSPSSLLSCVLVSPSAPADYVESVSLLWMHQLLHGMHMEYETLTHIYSQYITSPKPNY